MRIALFTLGLAALLCVPARAFAQADCASSCSTTSSNRCANTQACICTISPHWKTSSPVTWFLNGSAAPNGVSIATTETQLKTAFDNWGLQSCSRLRLSYGGQKSFATPNSAINANDRANNLSWITSGWSYGSATLGVTHPVWNTGTNEIIDADIEFNNAGKTWSTTGANGSLDVQSIATHEGGHFWGAVHSPNAQAVMYYAYSGGLKRTPTSDDVAQLCCLYPASAATGAQGDFCTTTSNCQSGLVCAKQSGGTDFICTKGCTPGGTACPSGYDCQAATTSPTSGTANACFVTPTANTDLCKFCEDGTDCSSGICLFSPPYTFCSANCTSNAQCGVGFECVTIQGANGSSSSACAPVANANGDRLCPGSKPQCSATKSCPTYFHCETSTGMCRGGLQDESCAIEDCANTTQNVCLQEPDEDLCRKYCSTKTDCPLGQTCYTLTGSTKKACSTDPNFVPPPDAGTPPDAGGTIPPDAGVVIPPDAGTVIPPDAGTVVPPDAGTATVAGPCQPCGGTVTCGTGYTCVPTGVGNAGVCYKNCSSDSQCAADSACYWTDSSTAPPKWCACPGELAARDQPCGSKVMLDCSQSDVCVAPSGSTDYRCRQQCSVNGDCPSNRCASLGNGVGACLPAIPADAGTTIPPDAGTVVPPDASTTVKPDAATPIPPDAATMVPPDAGKVDISPDASVTVAPDASGSGIPNDAGEDGLSGTANSSGGCGCGSSGDPSVLFALSLFLLPVARRRVKAQR